MTVQLTIEEKKRLYCTLDTLLDEKENVPLAAIGVLLHRNGLTPQRYGYGKLKPFLQELGTNREGGFLTFAEWEVNGGPDLRHLPPQPRLGRGRRRSALDRRAAGGRPPAARPLRRNGRALLRGNRLHAACRRPRRSRRALRRRRRMRRTTGRAGHCNHARRAGRCNRRASSGARTPRRAGRPPCRPVRRAARLRKRARAGGDFGNHRARAHRLLLRPPRAPGAGARRRAGLPSARGGLRRLAGRPRRRGRARLRRQAGVPPARPARRRQDAAGSLAQAPDGERLEPAAVVSVLHQRLREARWSEDRAQQGHRAVRVAGQLGRVPGEAGRRCAGRAVGLRSRPPRRERPQPRHPEKLPVHDVLPPPEGGQGGHRARRHAGRVQHGVGERPLRRHLLLLRALRRPHPLGVRRVRHGGWASAS